jgi:hypothetical protein
MVLKSVKWNHCKLHRPSSASSSDSVAAAASASSSASSSAASSSAASSSSAAVPVLFRRGIYDLLEVAMEACETDKNVKEGTFCIHLLFLLRILFFWLHLFGRLFWGICRNGPHLRSELKKKKGINRRKNWKMMKKNWGEKKERKSYISPCVEEKIVGTL